MPMVLMIAPLDASVQLQYGTIAGYGDWSSDMLKYFWGGMDRKTRVFLSIHLSKDIFNRTNSNPYILSSKQNYSQILSTIILNSLTLAVYKNHLK